MQNEVVACLNSIVGLTAIMWVPYALNRAYRQGLLPAMGYDENLPTLSPWALRMKAAHYNAVENLVILAPTTILYIFLNGSEMESIKCALTTYFFCRIVHYLTYTFKVPYVRTLAFFAGWGATMFIFWKVCSLSTQA